MNNNKYIQSLIAILIYKRVHIFQSLKLKLVLQTCTTYDTNKKCSRKATLRETQADEIGATLSRKRDQK